MNGNRSRRWAGRWALALVVGLAGCSSDDASGGPPGSQGPGGNNPPGTSGGHGPVTAGSLAARLRGQSNFMIGIGNTDDSAYDLKLPLDIHYEYLNINGDDTDWPTWNTDAQGQGAFATMVAEQADKNGMTPMFTIYGMAAHGDGDLAVLSDASFMKKYWDEAKLLMTRLQAFGKPAMVQLEPDFWGYAVAKAKDGNLAAKVSGGVPECSGLTDTLAGFSACWLTLRDKIASKVAIGFHVSDFGADVPTRIAFFKAVGADKGDFLTTDMLDRDAGCFEAKGAGCDRDDGPWYWDESNQKSPNFHEHLAWVKEVTSGLGLPMLWWQVPLGVPSDTPGGTPGHYRDNRVKYIFEHVTEFVAAGGIGAVFGTGAEGQTDYKTDGGQFKNAVTKYFASPAPL